MYHFNLSSSGILCSDIHTPKATASLSYYRPLTSWWEMLIHEYCSSFGEQGICDAFSIVFPMHPSPVCFQLGWSEGKVAWNLEVQKLSSHVKLECQASCQLADLVSRGQYLDTELIPLLTSSLFRILWDKCMCCAVAKPASREGYPWH